MNYFDNPRMSQSKMKVLLESPRLFYLKYISGELKDDTTVNQNFGNCLDLALTEPEKYKALEVKNTKTTKKDGFVTLDWQLKINKYVNALHNYKFNNPFFNGLTFKEIIKTCKKQAELYYTYQDIEWKAKQDFLNGLAGFFIDVKSTSRTSYEDYYKDFIKFGYYLQGASYANAIKIIYKLNYMPRAFYIAISTLTGEIFCVECSTKSMDLGMMEIDRGCSIYKENLLTNEWCKNKDIQIFDLPDWKEKQIINNYKIESEIL